MHSLNPVNIPANLRSGLSVKIRNPQARFKYACTVACAERYVWPVAADSLMIPYECCHHHANMLTQAIHAYLINLILQISKFSASHTEFTKLDPKEVQIVACFHKDSVRSGCFATTTSGLA